MQAGDLVMIVPCKEYIPEVQSLLKRKGPLTKIVRYDGGGVYRVELDDCEFGWFSRYLMELCDME